MLARNATDIGQIVRERRRDLHLTQAQLAERSRISRLSIVRIEAGHERAEVGSIIRVLTELGLDLDIAPRPAPDIDLNAVLARTRGA